MTTTRRGNIRRVLRSVIPFIIAMLVLAVAADYLRWIS